MSDSTLEAGGPSEAGGPWVPVYGLPLSGPGPSKMADLNSAVVDLEFAARMFSLVATTNAEANPDERRAFYDAACMAYRRCFASGRSLVTRGAARAKVPLEIVESLTESRRAAHDHVLHMANEHIAHRVADAEQGKVLLLLDNPSLGKAVQGVFFLHLRFAGPTPTDARDAAATAQLLAECVGEFAAGVQQRLLAEAQSGDLEAFYAAASPLD